MSYQPPLTCPTTGNPIPIHYRHDRGPGVDCPHCDRLHELATVIMPHEVSL